MKMRISIDYGDNHGSLLTGAVTAEIRFTVTAVFFTVHSCCLEIFVSRITHLLVFLGVVTRVSQYLLPVTAVKGAAVEVTHFGASLLS
jgi:hypothetical protein